MGQTGGFAASSWLVRQVARSKAFFASILWPPGQKEWRLAGRDSPVLGLLLDYYRRGGWLLFTCMGQSP
jgi:hypothetical protein